MNNESQRGMIALEACITVLSFVMLMLFFSSFFLLFMVQNMTSHTIMQTAQSLALDVYTTESLIREKDGNLGGVNDYFQDFIVRLFGDSEDSPYFISDTYWHKEDDGEPSTKDYFTGQSYWDGSKGAWSVVSPAEGTAVTAENKVTDAVELKFIGYFSGGDEDTADKLLTSMNVVDGLEGLDFSGSYVENDILYIVLKYELEYDFDLWGADNLIVEQKSCARLWKVK